MCVGCFSSFPFFSFLSFCQNIHVRFSTQYIASQIYSINEWGTYRDPTSLSSESESGKAALKAQDDEIFERARLVNTGFFMQMVLGDYVGAILGLVRDGLEWRLDPLSVSFLFSFFLLPLSLFLSFDLYIT